MKDLPLPEVYKLLEPGPVVLLTTARRGRHNVMTMSWHLMVDFFLPLISCVVRKVVKVGNCSGSDIDKFAEFALTPKHAEKVAAPLIDECFGNLECRVIDTRFVSKYGIFILEVVKGWQNPAKIHAKTIHHRGFGTFAVDGEIIHLPSEKP
jgi:flavin reductase (DIM6/NTAB) family NADH-FMN oxidoreductase RutF